MNAPIAPPLKFPILFQFTKIDMINDSQILKNHNFNISELIQSYINSDLSYGNEFRPVYALEPLLHKHKDWIRLK